MPNMVLRALDVSAHLIFTATLQQQVGYGHPHSVDMETKAEKG